MPNLLHSEPSLKGAFLSTAQHYTYLKCCDNKNSMQIAAEALDALHALAECVNELILIAPKNSSEHPCCVADILKVVLQSEKPFCLRLTNLSPQDVNDELIAHMQRDSRLLPYIDMRMLDIQTAESHLSYIRSKMPHITLRASFEVDIANQTDEQFQALCSHIANLPVNAVDITLNSAVQDQRLKALRELQLQLASRQNAKLIGTQLDVLIEGYHPESRLLMRGRHDGQCPEIDGSVIINDGRKVTAFGKKYRVEITDVSDYDLIGRVI